MTKSAAKLETLPHLADRIVYEKIGKTEWELKEIYLDVHEQVALWAENPRLQTTDMEGYSSEADLEEGLRILPGYDGLRKSIRELGQMQAIYVQRTTTGKFLVLEGATRVTILRELDRKYTSGKEEGLFRHVQARILPQNFTKKDLAVLLASIHVRGPNVRAWGRFIEAKFIYDTVVGRPGHPAVMNQVELAENMGKRESWVSRLKGAYEFALKFVEYADDMPDPRKFAAEKFTVLEEISKVRTIGPQLRDFDNKAHDELRHEVFEMVRNDVFKEHRDARFLKEFHDDEDAWAQLKSGEKHVANKLAQQTQDRSSHPRMKIAAMPQLVRRAIDRGENDFDDGDVANLQQTIDLIEDSFHDGVHPYRLALKKATRILNKASKADVIDLQPSDVEGFREAYAYFDGLVGQHLRTGGG